MSVAVGNGVSVVGVGESVGSVGGVVEVVGGNVGSITVGSGVSVGE